MQEMLTGALLNAAGMVFHCGFAAVVQFLGWIGWPGVIAIASGCLLLLSLSMRAVKFLNSPRGMAVTGGITAAALLALWLLWPKLAAAQPKELAGYEPSPLRTDGPVPRQKAKLASKATAATAATASLLKPAGGPLLAYRTPVLPVVPLALPVIARPLVAPPVVIRPSEPVHHATARPQVHVAAARPELPPAREAVPAPAAARSGDQRTQAQKDAAFRDAMAFQTQGYRRAQLNNAREAAMLGQQYDAMMGQMARGTHSGGVHPGVVHHGGTIHHGGMIHHGGR